MKIISYKSRGKTLYKFCAYLGTDPTGKQKQVRRSGFKTKLEAEKAYIKVKEEAGDLKAPLLTLDELALLWMDNYILSVRPSSANKTEGILKNHISPVFGSMPLDSIEVIEIQKFCNSNIQEYKSGHKINNLLKSLFDYAFRIKAIKDNPFNYVILVKKKRSSDSSTNDKGYYTKEELVEFLTVAKKEMEPMWFLFFHLLAYTGIRRGEALALMWDKIDFQNSTLKIDSTISKDENKQPYIASTKTSSGVRIIDLDDTTLSLLKDFKHNKSAFIFCNTKNTFITASQPQRRLLSLCKRHGLKYISPHGFRHTHCSMLFAAGVPLPIVQHRLGHKDIHTTMNIYNHVYNEDKTEAVIKFVDYLNFTYQ